MDFLIFMIVGMLFAGTFYLLSQASEDGIDPVEEAKKIAETIKDEVAKVDEPEDGGK